MVFSSIPFLYYFLPGVLLIYFLTPRKWKNLVLFLSSLIFYGWGEPRLLWLMVFTILFFYLCGLAIERAPQQGQKKFWMVLSAVVSIGLLGIFKYADFFISSFNAVTGLGLPLLKIALPVGISFYTFQSLSYTIDVYRRNVPAQKSLIRFGTYVSLFPQLIAGPIVRYVDVARELDSRTHTWEDAALGLRRFLAGLGKKIILADNFALLIRLFRESSEPSILFYWMYAAAFTLNIYFDFSGYSDMAIGLGRIFGFRFLENFDYPYLSKSITEFWRRWHISLGSWFRDYVYIPLGGSRVSAKRWVLNILTVWMLTGLWHGAAWNFVLWGLFYAVLLLAENFAEKLTGKWTSSRSVPKKIPGLLSHCYVLLAVTLGFVLFNAESLSQAASDLACLFGFGGLPAVSGETLYYLRSYALLFLLGILGSTPVVRNTALRILNLQISKAEDAGSRDAVSPLSGILQMLAMAGLLLICTGYLADGSFSPFLYFRF